MNTQNVKTAAQETAGRCGKDQWNYTIQGPHKILLTESSKKEVVEEYDVMEFGSLQDLQDYRRRCPEVMSENYMYALVNTEVNGRYINIVEGSHFKQFVKAIKIAGLEGVFEEDSKFEKHAVY